MKRHVFTADGRRLLRVEEAFPECGAFCDTCGDCIHCYGEDGCRDGGDHYWVEYEDEEEPDG